MLSPWLLRDKWLWVAQEKKSFLFHPFSPLFSSSKAKTIFPNNFAHVDNLSYPSVAALYTSMWRMTLHLQTAFNDLLHQSISKSQSHIKMISKEHMELIQQHLNSWSSRYQLCASHEKHGASSQRCRSAFYRQVALQVFFLPICFTVQNSCLWLAINNAGCFRNNSYSFHSAIKSDKNNSLQF